MKTGLIRFLMAVFAAVFASAGSVSAQEAAGPAVAGQTPNRLENFEAAERDGTVYVRLTMRDALAAAPASFAVASPARIVLDFPQTANGLDRGVQTVAQGDLRTANAVQAGDRTRVVLNLVRMVPYDIQLDGRTVVIALNQAGIAQPSSGAGQIFSDAASPEQAADKRSIRDVTFRRGKDGEGRVVVQLSNPDTAINIRQQGGNLVVDFGGASLPEHLRRRADVTDFATPVTSMLTQQEGDSARLTVTPHGKWEHNAYQSDTLFVLEVKRVVEDPNKLVQRGQFLGEKLSLNFQNIDVRSVLQVIADFTNFNIITSDSVQGSLTLRLKDVPWDQALDIILQAKGLDMRKNGNVIWIAPGEELAIREKLQLEAKAQIGDLEPLETESFQINYHKAKEINDFLKNKDQTMLSKRGSVVVDDRSNKIFVTDVAARLLSLRKLIGEIDVAPRQVLIEARIVEANKDFARDLGVRLGYGDLKNKALGNGAQVGFGSSEFVSYKNDDGGTPLDPTDDKIVIDTDSSAGVNGIRRLVGESARSGVGFLPVGFGNLNLTLFNSGWTRFLNLELSALESDGRGRIVSSPRVMTANQVEAVIEQGTEIPYAEATSSGAASVSFKKAVLSLKVKPQITPDGRIQLQVQVNKDRPEAIPGYATPAISTKNVKSEVLVENGGTVVIGGVYEEDEANTVTQVPLLGDLPVIGHLFRTTSRNSKRRELLVFITPRIMADALTMR